MNKKTYSLFLLITLFISLSVQAKHIIIDSAILRAVDGTRFLSGDDYGIMLNFRNDLYKLLYGIKDSSGTIVGPIHYNGNAYCLKTLCENEKQFDYETKKALLQIATEQFKQYAEKPKKRGEGTKRQQQVYIEASLKLHKMGDCILRRWAEAPEGKEDDAIDKQIHTFTDLALFFKELINFFGDMLGSCPNAQEQFLSTVTNHQERAKIKKLLTHIFQQQKDKIHKAQSKKK